MGDIKKRPEFELQAFCSKSEHITTGLHETSKIIFVRQRGNWLRAVHKRRPQSGEVCPVWTFCGRGVFLDAAVLTFWGKNFWMFKIYGVSALTRRGSSQCVQGVRGSIFRDFVRTFFMDQLIQFQTWRIKNMSPTLR